MFDQLKKARSLQACPIEWERFKNGFLDRFFPLETREAKILEFMNHCTDRMCVEEYSRVFTKLSRYASFIVADHEMKMSKFVSCLFCFIAKECCMVM